MTALAWQEAPLTRSHDRNAFDCGDDDLNTYLRRYARQNHESGGAKCFVAVERAAPSRILGFYTLSPASIEFSRAPSVPVYRLGRLAIDRGVQGRGLGGRLLWCALERCLAVAREVRGSRRGAAAGCSAIARAAVCHGNQADKREGPMKPAHAGPASHPH
jgi:GNAT superfamily N-acetyltransferase